MQPTILIVATLDTKEEEAAYLKKLIEDKGFNTILVDAGILHSPTTVKPDVTREKVALAGGIAIDKLLAMGNKGKSIDVMITGTRKIARELYEEGKYSGVIGIGGAQGTNIATSVMRDLPFGVPKLMVSTIACGTATFGPFVGTKDVTMMHSVVDLQGLNVLIIRILQNAAAGICGMVSNYVDHSRVKQDNKTVAMSMLGTTTPGAMRAQEVLEKKGFQVVAFHQNGTGGIAMEDLIREGFFKGVLDLNLHELADVVAGGLHASIKDYRLESASKAGIPQVIAPGSIDYTVQGPVDTLSPEMKQRKYIVHNPTLTLVRLTKDEITETAKLLAKKINQAKGPVEVFLPLKGFSYPDREGLELWDPEGNAAFIDTFKDNIASNIPVKEVNAHINDAEFIDQVVASFIKMM